MANFSNVFFDSLLVFLGALVHRVTFGGVSDDGIPGEWRKSLELLM
jgi:hypothetical protein